MSLNERLGNYDKFYVLQLCFVTLKLGHYISRN
jgi:hypothetical protein